ncbi:MAG: glycosyltransferase family 87 protein [Gemmataceae bacterium]
MRAAAGIASRPWIASTSQLGWTVWGIALAGVVGAVLLSTRQGIFPVFTGAGRAWLESRPIYEEHHDLDRFLYAPIVAPLFAPLSLLPGRLAGVSWRLFSVAVFGWAMARYLRRSRRQASAAFWLLILPLMLGSIHNGQTNVLLLGVMLLGVVALREERWWLAALCLGAATLCKIYPGFLALLAVLYAPRALLWRLPLVLAAGLALPFLLQHPDYVCHQYADWWQALRVQDRTLWALERAPRDLLVLFRLTGSLPPLPLYWGVQLLLTIVMVRLARVRIARGNEQTLHVLFTLGVCWMVTLGPATESSTYCFLAPVLGLALLEERRRPRRNWLGVIYLVLVFSAAACWFPLGKHWAGVTQPLAGLAFFLERIAWAARLPARRREESIAVVQTRVVMEAETKPCADANV